MLSRSNERPKFFTFAEYIIPENKEIYTQIKKLADFNKKILFEVATISAFYLLNKRTINQKFKVEDIVYVPDRIIAKNPHSLTDALGKITEVKENERDYEVVMLDGTHLKRHFSDIVSASATKSGSDVNLIDPFQLINWKDKTPPDHLYPKFKPFLEEFKKGISTKVPRITYENPENHEMQEVPQQEIANCKTIEQRLQAANEKESPAGIDLVLKKLMDTTMAPDPLDIPDSLASSKRPKN